MYFAALPTLVFVSNKLISIFLYLIKTLFPANLRVHYMLVIL